MAGLSVLTCTQYQRLSIPGTSSKQICRVQAYWWKIICTLHGGQIAQTCNVVGTTANVEETSKE